MNKTAIVYYSNHGNVRAVANLLSERIGADIIELKMPLAEGLKGFRMYFRLGFLASAKRCPKIVGGEKDISGYENLILGSPVWAGTFSPALRTYFRDGDRRPVKAGKVGVFFCHKGGVGKSAANLDAYLGLGGRLISVDAVEPVLNSTVEQTADALLEAMNLKKG